MEFNGMENQKNVRFVPWDFPKKPSWRARRLIQELNRLGREEFGIDGPAYEYRAGGLGGYWWIDICFFVESDTGRMIKYAIEIDEEHHDCLEQKRKDKKKDECLRSQNWIVKRIHYTEYDKKNVGDLAWEILFEVGILKFQMDQKHLS